MARDTPCPITTTGYRSHFIRADALAEAGGAVAFLQNWMDREARCKPYRDAEYRWRQGDLLDLLALDQGKIREPRALCVAMIGGISDHEVPPAGGWPCALSRAKTQARPAAAHRVCMSVVAGMVLRHPECVDTATAHAIAETFEPTSIRDRVAFHAGLLAAFNAIVGAVEDQDRPLTAAETALLARISTSVFALATALSEAGARNAATVGRLQ